MIRYFFPTKWSRYRFEIVSFIGLIVTIGFLAWIYIEEPSSKAEKAFKESDFIQMGVVGEALILRQEKTFAGIRSGDNYNYKIYIEYQDEVRNKKVSKVIKRCRFLPSPESITTSCYSPFIMSGLGSNPRNIKMPIVYLADEREVVSFDVQDILKLRSEEPLK